MNKSLISMLALLALGGCVNPTPHLDERFGMAVENAKAVQTLNPEAWRNTDPVTGLGGIAADAAVDEYHDSFKRPPATFPVINIGVGGGGR